MEIDGGALAKLGVQLVVVFGSQARGQGGADSDLDVGVLFGGGADPNYRLLDEVRDSLGDADNLDLVCLNDANALLLNEVALDGIPRFQSRPGAFEEFRLIAFKRFIDTKKFREFELESLRAKLD